MISDWLFFAVLAALLFAITELFDKHFVDAEVNDYFFSGGIYSLPLLLVMVYVGFFKSPVSFEVKTVASGMVAGGMYSLILIFYLKGVSEEDISRFIPSLSLNTVIIAVLSAIFLGESLSAVTYGGILLTVAGAFLISLENPLSSLEKFQSSKAVLAALAVATAIAIRDIIIKMGASQASIWQVIFWIGVGGVLVSLTALLGLRRDKLGQIVEQKDLMAVGGLRSLGYLSYMVAISSGPVTLASAALKMNGMFVFIGATVLTLSGRLVHEKKDGKIILQKFIASAMIITGVIVMRVFSGA